MLLFSLHNPVAEEISQNKEQDTDTQGNFQWNETQARISFIPGKVLLRYLQSFVYSSRWMSGTFYLPPPFKHFLQLQFPIKTNGISFQ